jgi:hypothetical protein
LILERGVGVAFLQDDSATLSRERARELEELRRWSDNGRAVAMRSRVLARRLLARGVPLDDVAEAIGISPADAAGCLFN